ncbi:hypothetical protein [Leptotrichia massiliensis]|uniref:hypothetical protein n=1 Tax=Leptotrichia massiliensis TaxID=1852388 RepID=UPI0028D84C59|nr:hypothetical protein [Leptotrichia massiliensis]
MLEKLKSDIEELLKKINANLKSKFVTDKDIPKKYVELENEYFNYIKNNNDIESIQVQKLEKIKQELKKCL